MRTSKPHLIPFSQLRDNYMFRRLERVNIEQGDSRVRERVKVLRVFTKINDTHSIDARNGHDAIFLPHELVEPLFPASQDVV